MNDKIDIVVNWLNGADKHWLQEYNKCVNKINGGDKSICRFREWDFFKYFLRSVEQNCKWFNNVVIIVFDEHQIPAWLNTKCNKLKIIYHKDIMPSNVYPTFNGLAACCYGLCCGNFSRNFIYCNDDQFFIKPCTEDMFFKNNKCVKFAAIEQRNNSPYFTKTGVWNSLMKNTVLFKEKITNNPTYYVMRHMPSSFHKSDFINFYSKYKTEIDAEYSKFESKIRQTTNLVVESIVDYMQIDSNDFINDVDFYKNYSLFNLTNNVNWHELFNILSTKKVICINDHVDTTDNNLFLTIKNRLLQILNTLFSKKSQFEL